jgi:NitT/TauT family transport system permease protein
LSLFFTFTYATLAAKNKYAERLLVPLLDILQSVPILGFISITVVFFMALAPGRVLGAEFAAIFAIFTSQAWNMAFSFYQSLRTVPTELVEASRNFRLSPWMSFLARRRAVRHAAAHLEHDDVDVGKLVLRGRLRSDQRRQHDHHLPGVGSYIALAIEHRDLAAVGYAIVTMLIVILIYDQVLFPAAGGVGRSLPLRAGARHAAAAILGAQRAAPLAAGRSTHPSVRGAVAAFVAARWSKDRAGQQRREESRIQTVDRLSMGGHRRLRSRGRLLAGRRFVTQGITMSDVATTLLLGLATLSRIVVLIALATVVWVPIGVWVGTRPQFANVVQPVAQFLAAFPANLLFPDRGVLIVAFKLNPNIWLSPLMILGTQWYILFNVVAGAIAIPAELRAAGANFRVRGWLWWRRIAIPAVLPYYVTGAITASAVRGTPASSPRSPPGVTSTCKRRGSAPISPSRPMPATSITSCSASR